MKSKYFLLLLVIVGLLSSCGPTPEEAAAYNDSIVTVQLEIDVKINALIESYHNYIDEDIQTTEGIEKAYNDAMAQVDKSIQTVAGMENFAESSELKDDATKLFGTYKSLLENEYKEMMQLYALPDSSYTQEHDEKWENLNSSSISKTKEAIELFVKAQQKFVTKYKLALK